MIKEQQKAAYTTPGAKTYITLWKENTHEHKLIIYRAYISVLMRPDFVSGQWPHVNDCSICRAHMQKRMAASAS